MRARRTYNRRSEAGGKNSLECECGKPKERGVYGCVECRRLEGLCTGDVRKRSVVVGFRARVHDGSRGTGRALDAWLRGHGLIDDGAWRNSNMAVAGGGRK